MENHSIDVINVVTRLQDDGDGGYTMYVYNNNEEMLADHPRAEEAELTEEQKEEILNGDDEYKNGYLGKDIIKIKTVDGKLTLAQNLSFHGGQ